MLRKPLRQLLREYSHEMYSHDLNEIRLLREKKTIQQLHQRSEIELEELLNYPKPTRIEQMVYLILLSSTFGTFKYITLEITLILYVERIFHFIHTNVDNRDAKFISRFPFKFNNTGTKTNNSVTLVKTGQY